jgi:hypothetical protein
MLRSTDLIKKAKIKCVGSNIMFPETENIFVIGRGRICLLPFCANICISMWKRTIAGGGSDGPEPRNRRPHLLPPQLQGELRHKRVSESAVSSSSLFASLLWIIEQSGLLLGVLPVQPPAIHHLVIIEYFASKAGPHCVEARQQ